MRWPSVRRLISAVLRWSFIVIGAVTTASVLFTHLYAVNATIYDPSAFAIGVAGLFAMGCGVMLMVLSRNSRQRLELRRSAARCEELADHVWELKEAEERATSLLEAQGDLIVRRDSDGRITYANDAFCRLAGKPRAELLGTATVLPVLTQGETTVLADGTRVHDQQIMTADGARWLAWREVLVLRPRPQRPRRDRRASAATSPTAPRPSRRWPKRATRPKPPTAPSRASSRRSRTRSARR